MLNMFRGLFGFGRKCLELLSGERNLYILFLILSLVMALTEGFGVSMVAPLLDLQAGSNFTRVPLLGNLTSAFANMPPGQRIPMIALVLAIVVVFRGAIQFAVDALSAIIPLRVQRRLSLSGYSALMGVQHQDHRHRLRRGVYQLVSKTNFHAKRPGLAALMRRASTFMASRRDGFRRTIEDTVVGVPRNSRRGEKTRDFSTLASLSKTMDGLATRSPA